MSIGAKYDTSACRFAPLGAMTRDFLPVQVAQRWLLFRAEPIREILGAQVSLPIPGARPEVPAVFAWRGRAVPVVDVAPLLGFGSDAFSAQNRRRSRTVIVEHARSVVGVTVDWAREVQRVDTDVLAEPHAERIPYARAELHWEDVVMTVVDLDLLLEDLTNGGKR